MKNWVHFDVAQFFIVLLLLFVGTNTGFLCYLIGVRAPWFFGALISIIAITLATPVKSRDRLLFPEILPRCAIAGISLIFGTKVAGFVSSDLLTQWVSFAAVILFVFIAQFCGFFYLHFVAGFSKSTAWHSATPGGLVESVASGQDAKGDKDVIFMLHLLRIMLILISLPLLYSVWFGFVPQSETRIFSSNLSGGIAVFAKFSLIIGLTYYLASYLPIPGARIIIPFFVGIGIGLLQETVPIGSSLLVVVVQILLGCSLGLRVGRVPYSKIVQLLGHAIVNCTILLIIAVLLGGALALVGGPPLWYVGLIMAPAGVAEMGVIAISLDADPIGVIFHHILRIGTSILILPSVFRLHQAFVR